MRLLLLVDIMEKFIVENCPCIRLYKNSAICINGLTYCAENTNCVIKKIVECAMLNSLTCTNCNWDCEDCAISEGVKISNDIIRRLKPKIMEEKDGN